MWEILLGFLLKLMERTIFLQAGIPVQERSGKCTAILRKENSAWLLEHEHCSLNRTMLRIVNHAAKSAENIGQGDSRTKKDCNQDDVQRPQFFLSVFQ